MSETMDPGNRLEHLPPARPFKGTRDVTNAVLAHRRCNNIGYKLEELRAHLEALQLEDGSSLPPGALEAAMVDHIEQRMTAAGRYPRSGGSRKRAIRIARGASRRGGGGEYQVP
jgi:hypothetical protein